MAELANELHRLFHKILIGNVLIRTICGVLLLNVDSLQWLNYNYLWRLVKKLTDINGNLHMKLTLDKL
jgi:hypothetical protein